MGGGRDNGRKGQAPNGGSNQQGKPNGSNGGKTQAKRTRAQEPRAESSRPQGQHQRREETKKDHRQSGQKQGGQPAFMSLFQDDFATPTTSLTRFITMDDSTTLISELSFGKNLDKIARYFEWNCRDMVELSEIVQLLVILLGRPLFLDATQQEQVNLILETLLSSQFFVLADHLNLFFNHFQLTTDFDKHFCNLVDALLQRKAVMALTRLKKLFLQIPPSTPSKSSNGEPSTAWRKLYEKYVHMVNHWAETGEVLGQTREIKPKRLAPRDQPQAAPARVEYADDPPRHEHAISARSIPTPEELTDLNMPFAVRTNPIVNGEGFGSVEEYLDTQWRLLRADALEDIRSGIRDLIKAKEVHRIAYEKALREARMARLPTPAVPPFHYPFTHNYYAYTRVKFLSFGSRKNGGSNSLNFQIAFQIPSSGKKSAGSKPMDWQRSKRLLPGSLLVLSSDNFKTLVWAVVAARDNDLLNKNMTVITLDASDFSAFNPDEEFEMLETRAFWTSYSHVLSKLASLMSPTEPFPLEDIIIGQNAGDNRHLFPGTFPLIHLTKNKSNAENHRLQAYLTMTDDQLRGHFRAAAAAREPAEVDDLQARLNALRLNAHAPAPRNPFAAPPIAPQAAPANQPGLIGRMMNFFAAPPAHGGLPAQPPAYPDEPIALPAELPDVLPAARPAVPVLPAALPSAPLGIERFLQPSEAVEAHDPAFPEQLTFLDQSQWRALKMILTQRVSIIQGPPGTGKTFLGTHATRTLLEQQGFQGPILCVCYTNHALDQFLEGIMAFESKVVRIGSRSKNPALQARELFTLMAGARPSSRAIGAQIRAREESREGLYGLFREMNDRKAIFTDFLSLFQLVLPKKVTLDAYIARIMGVKDLPSMTKPDAPQPALVAPSDSAIENDEDFEEDSEEVEDEINERAADPEFEDDRNKDITPEESLLNDSLLESMTEGGTLIDVQEMIGEMRRNNPQYFMSLPVNRRRSLLLSYSHYHKKEKMGAIRAATQTFNAAATKIQNIDVGVQVDFLRTQRVIGMTTTGAAKHATMIKALGPQVVIIEEAAEIFEAHTVACLTSRVQKLILIGDHQQLRPKVNFYPLVKRGLDISLFERLVKAGIPHVTLKQQHRMHPSISRYVRPIYPHLIDGPRTLEDRPETLGIKERVFFLSHNWPESGSGPEEEASSKSNVQEAAFVYGLARYLLAQGYPAEEINVITMYQGQNSLLRRFFRQTPPSGFPKLPSLDAALSKIRICCVDDYQGEENKIIIVSLVRSNKDGNVGFVKIANRVCVALSRAKSSMYVVGSETTLRRACAKKPANRNTSSLDTPENLALWPQILDLMHYTNCIGPSLALSCPSHGSEQEVAEPSDWARSLNKCTKPCLVQRGCGHTCPSSCHAAMPHPPCMYECPKIHPECNHPCPKRCHEACGRCNVMRPFKHARCGHVEQVACHILQDEEATKNLRCRAPCERNLPCGHRCRKMCGQPCDPKCYELIDNVKLPCGQDHVAEKLNCFIVRNPALLAKIGHACTSKLDCGHTCVGDCTSHILAGKHSECTGKCARALPCTHVCRGNCKEPCPPCNQRCVMSCSHARCLRECSERCIPCMMPCAWTCKHKKCNAACSDPCDREGCDEACEKLLPCGHPCIGLCGETCPTTCRTCNPDTEVFTSYSYPGPLKDDDEKARYILLPGCRHNISAESMDHWIKVQGEEDASVSVPRCPMCKSPITLAFGRYANAVKKQLIQLDKIRAMYRKDAIRAKFQAGAFKDVKAMTEKTLKQPAMGHAMHPPPHDIDLLLILATALMKLGEDEKRVTELVEEVLRRDPENAEAKAIEAGLLVNIIPSLAAALQHEVRRGAWYTCRNGHPYAIGECGGAMVQARCPCGATIGGANHAVNADNRHYAGADGAAHPAWGDAANMANYDLRDIPDHG